MTINIKTISIALIVACVVDCTAEGFRITAKIINRPPYKFDIYSSGKVNLTFATERILPPESLIAHQKDTAYLIKKRFEGKTVRKFSISKNQYAELRKSVLPKLEKECTVTTPDSTGVYLEYVRSDSLYCSVGKYPDCPAAKKFLCLLFDQNTGYIRSMNPFFFEEFGLMCD